MASIFSQIISGKLDGHFVYEDDVCVAIMTIAPLVTGHVLVIPRNEIDHWDDLPDEISAHLMAVSKQVAKALKACYQPARVALIIAGLEVPHTHLHLIPINGMEQLDFANAVMRDANLLAADAQFIRAELES